MSCRWETLHLYLLTCTSTKAYHPLSALWIPEDPLHCFFNLIVNYAGWSQSLHGTALYSTFSHVKAHICKKWNFRLACVVQSVRVYCRNCRNLHSELQFYFRNHLENSANMIFILLQRYVKQMLTFVLANMNLGLCGNTVFRFCHI